MNNLTSLQPALDWFAERGWSSFSFQLETWQAYLNGESGLIHAATGTGKTYAAWFGPLLAWLAQHGAKQTTPPLTVLWITPMRALAADTIKALREPVDELGIPWLIESRTGDTSTTERNRQRKRLPSALVTTPESLSLLLSRADAPELFRSLKAVIVDEWHELMASKRGVQTELCLARLRGWQPDLRIWGLSATMGNLEESLRTLLGAARLDTGEIPSGRLIRGEEPKSIEIDTVFPSRIERFPWAGHLGLNLLPDVIRTIERSRSALVFTNTRFQTEIWYQELLEARPDWIGEIALHHSSLDKSTREWVETGLREGRLRCVVCTSSLDLGVDFSPVDAVLQVGSPKGASRLVQRTGRSGHQPGAQSRVTCVPTHAFELIEIAAARDAIIAGNLEARPPIRRPLDVLAQHLVTVALGGGFTAQDMFDEVRTAAAYRDLSYAEWEWTLDFVTRGGTALNAYAEYHRVECVDGRYMVEKPIVARLHRMSIGTIVSDASIKVKYLKGGDIGFAEESFLSRLKPGDKFTLGGNVLEFVRIREMTAWVRKARTNKGIVPRWYGGGLPLSAELTAAVRERLEAAKYGRYVGNEMGAVRPILELQAKWSLVPARDELLIERTRTNEGFHVFIYPFGGSLVHEGLASLAAYRLSRQKPITFSLAVNDYGFELLSADPIDIESALPELFTLEHLAEDLFNSLNESEMVRRQFREIARVSGLIYERFPGGQKSNRQLQASSGLIYDVFAKYDPENLLLVQAQREVMERQLESVRLTNTLEAIHQADIKIVSTRRPTPFAFPLIVERVRGEITSESLSDRVRKMVQQLEEIAGE